MNKSYIELINDFEHFLEGHFLPAASQLLWYKIVYISNRCGWPEWVQIDNMRLMSAIAASDKRVLIRSRDKLIEAGLIEYRQGQKGEPGKYRIIEGTSCCTMGVQNGTPNGTKNGTKNSTLNGTKNGTQNGSKSVPLNKTKTKTKKSISKDIQEKSSALDALPESLHGVFAEFEAHRKEIGKPMTERARKMLIKKLLSMSDDDAERAEILEQSIRSGWTGIFAAKSQNEEKGSGKKSANKFGNFRQRNNDHDALEQQLLKQRFKNAGEKENE